MSKRPVVKRVIKKSVEETSTINDKKKDTETFVLVKNDIDRLFDSLVDKNGKKIFKKKDIQTIKKIPLFEKTNNIKLIYEILSQAHDYGSDNVVSVIVSKDNWENLNEIFFNLPGMAQAKLKLNIDIDIRKSKLEIEDGIYTCPKCSSNQTIHQSSQVRRADEGMTTFVQCINCNYKWTD